MLGIEVACSNTGSRTGSVTRTRRGQLSPEDLKSACKSVAIIVKLFAIDHPYASVQFFNAKDIYDYCREDSSKKDKLVSYEGGRDDDDDQQLSIPQRPLFKFELDIIKTLLSDKFMNDCLREMFGVELDDSQSINAIIKNGPNAFSIGKQIRFTNAFLIQRVKDEDLRTVSSNVMQSYNHKKMLKTHNVVAVTPAQQPAAVTPAQQPADRQFLHTQNVAETPMQLVQPSASPELLLTPFEIQKLLDSSRKPCSGFEQYQLAHSNIPLSLLRERGISMMGDTYHDSSCNGYAESNQARSSKCTSQYYNRRRIFSSLISVSSQSRLFIYLF
jgi:hypothetical protein